MNPGLELQNIRTKRLNKNAIGSIAIKLSVMVIEIIKVSILLSYLSVEKYGVWLTIVSIVLWTHHFDFGLGTGLKYKLTEAIANCNFNKGKSLVSTAYVSMSIIMGLVYVLIFPIIISLNWCSILNTQCASNSELTYTVLSIFTVFILQFVLELICVVLAAYQRTAMSQVFKPIANIISLGIVLLASIFSSDSLIIASLAMTVPHLLMLLFASIYFYSKEYHNISPSIKFANKRYLKDIYSLGIKFFINQLTSLIVFATANFILSSIINPSEVSVYNTARTYYGIVVIFFTTLMVAATTPMTDAYVRGDISWVKGCMNKLYKIAYLGIIAELFIFTISDFAFNIWVGDRIIVPTSLAIAFVAYNILALFTQQYNHFLISVGKMNLNVIISCCKIVLFIPSAIYLVKLYGALGLVIATIIINTLPNLIFGGIQYKKIITNTATGIWNR